MMWPGIRMCDDFAFFCTLICFLDGWIDGLEICFYVYDLLFLCFMFCCCFMVMFTDALLSVFMS